MEPNLQEAPVGSGHGETDSEQTGLERTDYYEFHKHSQFFLSMYIHILKYIYKRTLTPGTFLPPSLPFSHASGFHQEVPNI